MPYLPSDPVRHVFLLLDDRLFYIHGLPRLGNLVWLHVKGIQFPTDHSNDPVLV